MKSEKTEKDSFEIVGKCLVIHGINELDHHEAIRLRKRSDSLISSNGIKYLIFDFDGVDFMDSSGIGLIMGRYKQVIFIGGKAAVCNVGENVNRIFSVSGLYKIIEKYPGLEEALKAYSEN